MAAAAPAGAWCLCEGHSFTADSCNIKSLPTVTPQHPAPQSTGPVSCYRDCSNAQHRKRNALRGGHGQPEDDRPLADSRPRPPLPAPRSEWSAPQLEPGLPGIWGSDLACHEGTLCCEPLIVCATRPLGSPAAAIVLRHYTAADIDPSVLWSSPPAIALTLACHARVSCVNLQKMAAGPAYSAQRHNTRTRSRSLFCGADGWSTPHRWRK